MKTTISLSMLTTVLVGMLQAQSITHPWHVIDRGGGRSTGSGWTLSASIGQPTAQVMSDSGITLEGGYISGARFLGGIASALDVQLESGWNMVSVPFIVSDYRKAILYPSATSRAFLYQGVYVQRDTLANGYGYWLKYPGASVSHFNGSSIARETISVADKWNMIGCLSYPIRTADIVTLDSVTLASNYWGYSSASGYFTEDTLIPGRGYWIKTHNAGRLVLRTGSVLNAPSPPSPPKNADHLPTANWRQSGTTDEFSRLLFKDAAGYERTLHYSTELSDLNLNRYELPPVPPNSLMDVRFGSNRMVEIAEEGRMNEVSIRLSSAVYPVAISWNDNKDASLVVGGSALSLKEPGSFLLRSPEAVIKLRLSPASGRKELPREFSLDQNYPNPFNPVTVIRYQLPVDSKVTLKIYSALGQAVTTLLDGTEDAGYKSVQWSAAGVASGVYFYRLEAGSFTQIRKMLVLK